MSYVVLVLKKRDSLWLVAALMFVAASVFVRASIELEGVRDFRPYYESFLEVKYEGIPPELLIEPYRLLLFKFVLLFGTYESSDQIRAIYYLHFGAVTAFFLWIAYLKHITFEVKLILFLAFYPPIAFVWIRAGMAYMATCVIFFIIASKRWRVLYLLLPAVHLSTIPLLLTGLIQNLTPLRKVAIISLACVVGYLLLESNYANYVMTKWDRYSTTSDDRTSSGLLLLHLANICIYLYLAVINIEFRKNFVVFVMMATYLGLYAINPIIGLRIFPFILIACITQRIPFKRYQYLTLLICLGLVPIFFARFEQILI